MTSPAEDVAVAPTRPQPRRGVSLRDAGPPVALLVIIAAFSVLSSDFRTLGNLQNIMDTAAVLAVVTCGITFVLLMGSIDLSAPGIMGAAAITVALLVANNRNDNELGLLGVLLAVLLAAGLGCLSGLALVVLMLTRPEGIFPNRQRQMELRHDKTPDADQLGEEAIQDTAVGGVRA